jgi:hypothetical protein
MKPTYLLCAALLALTGCAAPRSWVRDGTNNEQQAKDERECDFEGVKAAAPFVEFQNALTHIHVKNECMKSRGYSQ